jgi:hypothetical protein
MFSLIGLEVGPMIVLPVERMNVFWKAFALDGDVTLTFTASVLQVK